MLPKTKSPTAGKLIPRPATTKELDILIKFTLQEMTDSPEKGDDAAVQDLVARAAICVFDNYMPDCPGASGTLLTVIWPGDATLHEIFFIREGELVRVQQAESLSRGN